MGSFGIIKNGKKQIITGNGGSGGGHVIQNASGTNLTQRDTLQFKGGLKATDDSTNKKTVVDDSPTEITWAEYNAMTPEQQQALKHTLVTNVPSADGTISADLMTKLWENPSPTSAFVSQTITLNSADYDFLMIVYNANTSGAPISQMMVKGLTTILNYGTASGSGARNFQRTVSYISDTSISFANALVATGTSADTTNNSNIIPVVIYGIKKTVTVTFDALAENVSTLASNCMLSDGVTSVENVIDELNTNKANEWNYVDSVNYNGVAGAENTKTVTIPSGWKDLLLLVTLSNTVYASTEVHKNSVTGNNVETMYAGIDSAGNHTVVFIASLSGTTLKARHQYNRYGNSISIYAVLYYR